MDWLQTFQQVKCYFKRTEWFRLARPFENSVLLSVLNLKKNYKELKIIAKNAGALTMFVLF